MNAGSPVRDIVIVGASLAGLRAAETLRAAGFAGRLRLVGEEPHMPYNRPPLSKALLVGGTGPEELVFKGVGSLDAEWHLGDPAVALDPVRRVVTLAGSAELAYDRVLVATGMRARTIRAVPDGLRGVHVVRTVDDALRLRAALRTCRRLVVVGAGFVGCEVAASARALGVDVALVDASSLPLENALGAEPAGLLADRHRAEGVQTFFGCGVAGVVAEQGAVRAVRLDDGTEIPGDVVVVGVGGAPATEWLGSSGATLDDGVVCDASLRAVGLSGVWAAGDVVRWPHPALGGALTRVEHWTHAAMSGMAAARNMLALDGGVPFDVLPEFWSDQYDLHIRGMGRTGGALDVRLDEGVFVYRDDAGDPVGVLGFGNARAVRQWRRRLVTVAHGIQ